VSAATKLLLLNTLSRQNRLGESIGTTSRTHGPVQGNTTGSLSGLEIEIPYELIDNITHVGILQRKQHIIKFNISPSELVQFSQIFGPIGTASFGHRRKKFAEFAKTIGEFYQDISPNDFTNGYVDGAMAARSSLLIGSNLAPGAKHGRFHLNQIL